MPQKVIRVTAIFLLLLIGCSERKRFNPLDPLNPETKGRPVGLKVISEYRNVTLSWKKISLEDLQGYNIYRKDSQSENFRKIAIAHPDSARYIDRLLIYNVTYFYQISAATPSWESPKSEVVSITPGPSFNWVVDTWSDQVIKLTFDGLHVLSRTRGFYRPTTISAGRFQEGAVWVTDFYNSRLVKVSKKGEQEIVYSGVSGIEFNDISCIAVNENNGDLWIADQGNRRVVMIDTSGGGIISQGHPGPVSLSVNNLTGECWVADVKSKTVAKIVPKVGSIPDVFGGFENPVYLSVNPREGTCWVADSTRVFKLLSDGTPAIPAINGFVHAAFVSVNSLTGECWVLDKRPGKNNSVLVKLGNGGERLLDGVGAFTSPNAIAVNPFDGSCLVSDTGNRRIVRISTDGEVLSELSGFYWPWGVAITQ